MTAPNLSGPTSVVHPVDASGASIPSGAASSPVSVQGPVATGGTVGSNPVFIGGRDVNGVTLRALRLGAWGDIYNEGGTATGRLISAAGSTNATVVKAQGGKVFTIHGYNAAAALRYLKLYNKATAPTVGTDTPVYTFALPATAAFNITIPGGYQFTSGIGYALTVNAADADTTAVTAGDITCLHINYT